MRQVAYTGPRLNHNFRMTEIQARTALVEAGRRLWERDLVGATEGNLSVRLEDGNLLSTPSGVSKGHLAEEDLVVIDLDGNELGPGKVSSEIKMHLAIYKERPDCQAVVHAHPLHATALTLSSVSFPNDLVPEGAVILGPVYTVPFGMPGTEEVPDKLRPFLAKSKTLLLDHHGAVVLGSSPMDAVYRMETLERVARMYFVANSLGKVSNMPDWAVARIAPMSSEKL